MSEKATTPTNSTTSTPPTAEDKGKKAAPVDQEEAGSDSEMEEDDSKLEEDDAEDDSEDDMGEIDTSNIIESGRTRGRRVDYTKEVANVPEADDEEDDADFEEPATEEP